MEGRSFINILHKRGRWVNSRELYKLLFVHAHYPRWAKKRIEENPTLIEGAHYYPVPPDKRAQNGKGHQEYYVSLPVAIGLCMMVGTKKAEMILKYLHQHIY